MNLGTPAAPACCNLCGLDASRSHAWISGQERRFGLPGHFTLRQCPRCALIFLWPQPPPEALGAYYPRKAQYQDKISGIPPLTTLSMGTYAPYRPAQPLREGWRQRLKRSIYHRASAGSAIHVFLAHRLWPELPVWAQASRPWRALDVGCGNGAYLVALRGLGWQVVGVEPNVTAASAAGRRFQLFVYPGTLANAPFAAGSFDLVTFRHSLEHVSDPLADLHRASRLLRPGGRLLIECPNAAGLARRVFGSYWFHLDLPRHLYHFTPQSLRAMLRVAGCHVLSEEQVASTAGITGSLQYLANTVTGRAADNYVRWSRLARLLAWPVSQGAAWAGYGDMLRLWAVKP